jgi:hypothetical protein
MPGFDSSHGFEVSFSGVTIGYVTGFDDDAKAGSLVDATTASASILGSGSTARVLKRFDCTAIEPMTLSIQFIGAPSYTQNDVGAKGTLSFSAPGKSWSGQAILTGWNHRGRVNQYSEGTASFQLTGA